MNLSRRLFFNFSYFGKPRWDTGMSPPDARLHRQPFPRQGADLGCGTGTNVISLARAGWQVTGIDFAIRAIQVARRKTRQASIVADLRVGDVTRLEDINPPFDLILDIGCYHGLSSQGMLAYREQIKRLLAPTGDYLMYGFYRQHPEDKPGMQEGDVLALSKEFDLLHRQDGQDNRGRNSAWFIFRKKQFSSMADTHPAEVQR
jgi:SAM-dependent methyltransferase